MHERYAHTFAKLSTRRPSSNELSRFFRVSFCLCLFNWNSSNFFSFFPPSSFFHTRAHTDRAYDRTSFLFFPFPLILYNESSKRLEGEQETCFFKFGIILISPRYFEGDGEFLRRAKTREKLARSNLSHLLILQEPCSPKILGIKNLAEHNRSF